jgi:FimV-like protein
MLDDLHQGSENELLSELALLEKAYQLFERKLYADVMDNLSELVLKPVPTETRRDAKQLYMRAAEEEMKQLYQSERYGELTALYESNADKWPDILNPEVVLLTALAHKHLKQYAQALMIFEQIKLYDLSQESKGQYILGSAQCFMAGKNIKNAQRVLLKYKEESLRPIDQQRAIMLLADTYLDEGLHGDAILLYRSLIKGKQYLLNYELSRVYLSIGKISRMNGHYGQAEASLKNSIRLVEKDKEYPVLLQQAYIGLGEIYHDEKRYQLAAESYQRGFDLGYGPEQEDYWESRYRLAISYMESGENTKAESIFNEVSGEGDPQLQQMAQIRLGSLGLEKHLKKLLLDSEH